MKKQLYNILRNKKVVNAALTIPAIAVGTMSGSCAAGCPYGLVNDPHPGQCPRYTDLNGDGICDLSQTGTLTSTDPSTTDSNTSASNNSNDTNASANIDHNNGSDGSAVSGDDFHVIPLSLIIIGIYLFTLFLMSRGIISQKKYRRLWNLVLTAGFVGTGFTGALLLLLINLGIKTALNPSIDYWHVEISILMVIAVLIHMHIYRKPLKRMFKIFGSLQKPEKIKTSK
ncbi:MAG: hypothetical protein F8N15_06855 [Methanobacterium sp.]|nr:hypothetical protein [Methanobacterium sp.]